MKATFYVALGLLTSVEVHAASFDCKKAAAPVEKMICSDATLSDLDARLAQAYRRALSISKRPEDIRADQKTWLGGERKACADVACLTATYRKRVAVLEAEKEATYSFTSAPFITPKIISELSTGISDLGDQIVSINVTDSQGSNRFFGDVEVRKDAGPNPYVYVRDKAENGGSPPEYGYQYVGRTTSGIDVLRTSDSGGGSGVFQNLMLVVLKTESDGMMPLDIAARDQTVRFSRRRLVIKKLGEIGLGDRWGGKVEIVGNEIHVGKNVSPRPGDDSGKDRVIKIDYRP